MKNIHSHNAFNRDRAILDYLPKLDIMAERYASVLPPFISTEDLASAAAVGLVIASGRFNEALGIKFRTFAEQHVRGAMIDELRTSDPVRRSARDKIKLLKRTRNRLECHFGRPVSDTEMAEELGVTVAEFQHRASTLQEPVFISIYSKLQDEDDHYPLLLEDVLSSDESLSPDKLVAEQQIKEILAKILEELSKNERMVITLYFFSEMRMREIREVMGLTEGRISQILASGLKNIKKKLLKVLDQHVCCAETGVVSNT